MRLLATAFTVQGIPLWESLPALVAWMIGRRAVPAVALVLRRRRSALRPVPAVVMVPEDLDVRLHHEGAPAA